VISLKYRVKYVAPPMSNLWCAVQLKPVHGDTLGHDSLRVPFEQARFLKPGTEVEILINTDPKVVA